MARKPRSLERGLCHHVTVRCNNREFNLIKNECRSLMVSAIAKAKAKFNFSIYALCIMSNHVHYLMEPANPSDLLAIMHAINWYSAMCINRLLDRTGHFWEGRYHSVSFPRNDHQRVLNTLRYIHANPKAAGMRHGFAYAYSNWGIHDRLTDDGLTEWHTAFLGLAPTLDGCSLHYWRFCLMYRTKRKMRKKSPWGCRLLAGFPRGRQRSGSPHGQLSLFGDEERCQVSVPASIRTFTAANA
ncbi:MAG: transposase [Rhodospirillaceae bacterium]